VMIASQSILLLGLAGVLLWTSLPATLIAIGVFVPLIWLLMRIIHPHLQRLGRRSQDAKQGTLKAVQQALGGGSGYQDFGPRAILHQRIRWASQGSGQSELYSRRHDGNPAGPNRDRTC